MNLFVLLKMVPDTVEELSVAPDGRSLDRDALRFKLGDSDEHAVEEALLLKERHGGTITAVAIDAPEIDDALYTALAKGADRAVKLTGPLDDLDSLAAARLFASFLRPDTQPLGADTLILVRGQAIDELGGELGACLAHLLGLPHVCVVTMIAPEGDGVVVTKEFAGGLRGEFIVRLPAVLGIQSAEKPPRYVPIAKVRAAMKSGRIETIEVARPEAVGPAPERLYQPEATGHATMIDGTPEQIVDRIVDLLSNHSLI